MFTKKKKKAQWISCRTLTIRTTACRYDTRCYNGLAIYSQAATWRFYNVALHFVYKLFTTSYICLMHLFVVYRLPLASISVTSHDPPHSYVSKMPQLGPNCIYLVVILNHVPLWGWSFKLINIFTPLFYLFWPKLGDCN